MAFTFRTQLFGAVLFLALISQITGHSYVTSPYSRTNQKVTLTGCRGPNCLGPCDAPVSAIKEAPIVAQRGQNITIQWPRNNHAGGFIRFAWAPTAQSDDASVFDNHVQQINCHEVGGCYPDDPSNPNGGDSGPSDGSSRACSSSFDIPLDLTDGLWTLQWAWFGGAFALGDYYSCVDYSISGGSVGSHPTPVYKGGDYSNPTTDVCKFFNTDALHVCVNEPCQTGTFPYSQQETGIPAAGQLGVGIPIIAPSSTSSDASSDDSTSDESDGSASTSGEISSDDGSDSSASTSGDASSDDSSSSNDEESSSGDVPSGGSSSTSGDASSDDSSSDDSSSDDSSDDFNGSSSTSGDASSDDSSSDDDSSSSVDDSTSGDSSSGVSDASSSGDVSDSSSSSSSGSSSGDEESSSSSGDVPSGGSSSSGAVETQCSLGNEKCISATQYQTCTNGLDSNYWAQPQSCQSGLYCNAYGDFIYCTADAPSTVPSGESNDGSSTGDADSDSSYVPSSSDDGSDESSSSSSSSSNDDNDCVLGYMVCVGDSQYRTCTNGRDSNYWAQPQTCQVGRTCQPSGNYIYCV